MELPGAVADMAPSGPTPPICALSSKTEGFPLVAQEAMSAGVPVVTYDCPSGPRELVEHGVSGLLVGAGAKAGLAAALHGSPATPALLARLGDGALEASRRYDADAIAARVGADLRSGAMDRHGLPHGSPARRPWTVPFTRDGMPVTVPAVTPVDARSEAFGLVTDRGGRRPAPGWFVDPDPRPASRRPSSCPAPQRAGFLDAPRAPATSRCSTPATAVGPYAGCRTWPTCVELQHRGDDPTGSCSSRGRAARADAGRTSARTRGVEMEFWDRLPVTASWSRRDPTVGRSVARARPTRRSRCLGRDVPSLAA